MGRGNFQNTRTKFYIDIIICNDRYFPIYKGNHHFFTDQITVAFIVGIHTNGNIASNGFWPRGCYH